MILYLYYYILYHDTMLLLIISLLIGIAVSTIYHDIWVLILVCMIWMAVVFVWHKFYYKSDYFHIFKKLISIGIVFILSWVATWRYDIRYQDIKSDSLKYFQWDVLITKVNSASLGYNRYDIRDSDDHNWIFRTKWKYDVWDILQVSADVDLNDYLYENMSFDRDIAWLPKANQWFESLDDREYSFDYDKWLKMKWYVGILDDNRTKKLTTIFDDMDDKYRWWLYGSWDKIVLGMRAYIKKVILSTYDTNRYWWLMLGMIVWDRSVMDKADYDGFIDSGLVHLIAVSGGNISMLVIFLWFVLFFLPYYIRIGVILISIILYSMVCGLDSSVFRAMIMWWLTIFAIYTGRVTDGFRVLGLALVVMLLYDPYFLIYDMGFVLSFMATLGIMIITRLDILWSLWNIWKYKIIRYICHNYIIPSIWAVIGILPVLLFYNSQYNLTWFVSNLLVIPIVPIVMVGGIVVGLYSYLLPSILSEWLVDVLNHLLKWIYTMSQWANDLGVYIMVDGLVVKVFIIILVGWLMYKLYHINSESL